MPLVPVNPTGAANPNPYFLGLNLSFNAAFSSSSTTLWSNQLAKDETMSTEVLGLGWTDPAKRAREWTGARQADQPAPRTYYVSAKAYEATIECDRFKFDDDTYGMLRSSIEKKATMLAKEPDFQLRDLIFNLGSQTGAFQVGLDGLTHWNASHPVNYFDAAYGTYNNDYRGAAGVGGIGGPLAMQAYITARYDHMTRKAAHGEVCGILPGKMFGGSYLDAIAKHILNATFLGIKAAYGQSDNVGAAENMMRNTADWVLIPDFGTSLSWILADVSRGNMPFTIGRREMGKYAQQTDESHPVVFNEHKYVFGGYSRFVVAFGHPILSSISGPTAGA